MRVGIEITSWRNPRGYGRFTRGLVSALLETADDHEYVLIADAMTAADPSLAALVQRAGCQLAAVPTPGSLHSGSGQPRSFRDLLAMSAAVSRLPLDILFFPSIHAYFPVWPDRHRRVIVGIHDVTADDYPRLMFPQWRDRILWAIKGKLARRQAHSIIAVSDHARSGVLRRYGLAADRVGVVGEAPDADFRPMTDRMRIQEVLSRWDLQVGSYFMCLGGLNPHKNIPMLVEVFGALLTDFPDIHLMLVGPAEDDVFTPGVSPLRDLIAARGLYANVHLSGYLPLEEVVCLLNGAVALVMPSLNEGFGLGAVEAAACAAPVIATTSSPLPALLEGGGWFVDPHDAAAWEEALRACLTDLDGRAQKGAQALERARALTWGAAADQFRALIR